jgi:hypothetical protein
VKKKKTQSFSEAVAKSFGSGSSAGSKPSRSSIPRSGEFRSMGPKQPTGKEDEDEVLSTLKAPAGGKVDETREAANANRELF